MTFHRGRLSLNLPYRYFALLISAATATACSQRFNSSGVDYGSALTQGSTITSAPTAPPTAPPIPPTGAAFYVSPKGSDSNVGSLQSPFLTLEKAQAAMRASSTKTTYIRTGTFVVPMLTLTSADNGETWSNYPPDGYNQAVIDGGGNDVAVFNIEGGSNITINGLKIQNVRQFGIYNHGGTADPRGDFAQNVDAAAGNIFKNNEITAITVKGLTISTGSWTSGCIFNDQVTPNTQILNNYCHDVNSMGIHFGGSSDLTSEPGDYSGTLGAGNYISRTCLTTSDCGAIYAWNPNKVKSTNVKITNNFVKDYSQPGQLGHAIYLDYESSNVTFTDNIISGASNTAAVMVSDGNNNVFVNNILDLENGSIVLLDYLNITGHQKGTGNIFTNNVVLVKASAFTKPTGIAGSSPYLTSANDGPLTNFTVQDNFYCNYNKVGTGPWNDYGNQFGDTKPVLCTDDPGISGWAYQITSNSPVYSAPVGFGRIAGGWGPPGFILPQTGTAPSVP